jgi:signal peptidase I
MTKCATHFQGVLVQNPSHLYTKIYMNDENKNLTGEPTPPAPAPQPPVYNPLDPIQPPSSGSTGPVSPVPSQPAAPPRSPFDPVQPPAPAAPVINPTVPPTTTTSNEELANILRSTPRPTADDPQDYQDTGTLQKAGSNFMAVLGSVFSWILFPLAVVLILHFFIFQAYHVIGTSMNPTLQQTDYLIVSKVGYTQAIIEHLFHRSTVYLPKRGQIIVFHYPKDPSEVFVKRVIAEPGDHLVIKNGTVTLFTKDKPGGYNPDSSYEPAGTTTLIDTDEIIQPGNIFVMGDNRTPGGSYDSRDWGELPSSYIIGNAVLRLLPLDAVKIL